MGVNDLLQFNRLNFGKIRSMQASNKKFPQYILRNDCFHYAASWLIFYCHITQLLHYLCNTAFVFVIIVVSFVHKFALRLYNVSWYKLNTTPQFTWDKREIASYPRPTIFKQLHDDLSRNFQLTPIQRDTFANRKRAKH